MNEAIFDNFYEQFLETAIQNLRMKISNFCAPNTSSETRRDSAANAGGKTDGCTGISLTSSGKIIRCAGLSINCTGILRGIRAELQKIGVRTLIVEFEVCSRAGKLQGETVTEKAEYYQNRLLSGPEYIRSILQTYPELEKCCQNAAEREVDFAAEVILHLLKDKEKIEKELLDGKKIREITQIHWGRGDRHCGGRSVLEMELDCGESIFYKPHALETDRLFYRIIDRMERRTGGSVNTYQQLYRFISNGSYGWVRKAEYRECERAEEIQRFYRRIGVLAGISYFLGSHDFHYQNLIAHGEYPVLVDLEALFKTDQPIFGMDQEDQISWSVLLSGLFPGSMQESNLCAVTGGQQENFLYKVPKIIVDEQGIRIENVEVEMEKGKNIPNEGIDAADYSDWIVKGFREAYTAVKNGEFDDLTEQLDSRVCSRHLVKSTQIYQMILSASYHPSLLMEAGQRENYIRRMCGNRPESEAEAAELLAGDIPYFKREVGSRALLAASGTVEEHFFRETVQEALQRRKQEMNCADEELQCRLIRAALKLSGAKLEDLQNGTYTDSLQAPINTDNPQAEMGTDPPGSRITAPYLQIARQMAEKISSEAIWDETHRHVMWLSMKCVSKSSNLGIQKANFYLYEGVAGMVLFLKAMSHVGLETVDWTVMEQAERELFGYTDAVLEKRRAPISRYTGLMEGESSLVFTYQMLYRFTKESKYLDYASRHMEIVMELAVEDRAFDLVYGNAGAIIALCGMYELTGKEKYLKDAVRVEKILRGQAVEEKLYGNTINQDKGAVIRPRGYGQEMAEAVHWPAEGGIDWGMAHGNSGILMAYILLCRSLETSHRGEEQNTSKYSSTISGLLAYENFKYKTRTAPLDRLPSWCRGNLGILASYLFAKKNAAKTWDDTVAKLLNEIIGDAAEILESCVPRKGMCLCHGNIGNLILMKYCLRELGWENSQADELQRCIFEIFSKEKGLFSERENCGLMGGSAGIGLGSLWLLKDII